MKKVPHVVTVKGAIHMGNRRWGKFHPEIDNGCQITSISPKLVRKFRLKQAKLKVPIPMVNADGSTNRQKEATHVAKLTMKIGPHKEDMEALVLDIGDNKMLLGQDWLSVHNPTINWQTREVKFNRCPKKCGASIKKLIEPEKDEDGVSKGIMPDYIKPFKHMFDKEKFDKLPIRREWDHEINLLPDAPKEIPAKNFRLTREEEKAVDEFLDAELKVGKIRPSKSPYAAACFFILKKDKSRRLVQDYWGINKHTIKDKTPLPRIDDLIDTLAEGKIFTKMDIIWGYNNVRIKEGHEERAAFLTPRGLFEPLVMYFGLTNSPGTFMRMMSTIFRDMIREKKCVIYMDDIVFIGKNREELQKYTIEGLKILEKHDLYIKEKKCYWEVTEVPMLGHIVGNGQVRMEPNKVKVILDWKPPTCKKDVQKFNGFCNFYRRYITGYSNIARPITTLMGNKTFKWEKKEQDAFEELKRIVASEQVITLPIADGKYRVEADASGYAIGATLSQLQKGKWRTVALLS